MKEARYLCLALLIMVGMGTTSQAAIGRKTTLIVMPVRYTVVQFAFDVARIRPVELVAYDKGTGDEPLLLHVWDTTANNWKPADVAALQDGSLLNSRPKRAYLVGSDADLPSELADVSAWCKDVTRVPSLRVIDMANKMNPKLKFSGREWRKLAKRHNLKLTDDNAEARRYGRYGKPGAVKAPADRPVNPLVARFRRTKSTPAVAPEAVEDAIEVEDVETDAAVEEPAWSPAEAKDKTAAEVAEEAVTRAPEEAAAVLEVEPAAAIEQPAEFK